MEGSVPAIRYKVPILGGECRTRQESISLIGWGGAAILSALLWTPALLLAHASLS